MKKLISLSIVLSILLMCCSCGKTLPVEKSNAETDEPTTQINEEIDAQEPGVYKNGNMLLSWENLCARQNFKITDGAIEARVKENQYNHSNIYSSYFFDEDFSETDLVLPNEVKFIGDYAFYKCNFNSITMQEGLTNIGTNAFYKCQQLTSVTIPKTISDIGEDAFACCNNLNNINLPEGLRVINPGTFFQCKSMQSIYIPESVTEISYAFNQCNAFLTIHGKSGSYAETFAKENGYTFVAE